MNIKITSRKFRAKESTKAFIQEEVGALDKYYDSILDTDVILSFENLKDSSESVKTAEIILQIPGKVLTATESADEFNKAVSAAVEKMIKQLKKVKTKTRDSKRTEKVQPENI